MSSPPPSWPATLPQGLLVAGLQYSPERNATAIPTEVGEVLTRQRFTGRMVRLSGALLLTSAQYADLLAFYFEELRETTPFTWADPVTGDSLELVFDGAPQGQPVTTEDWQVSVSLVSKPTLPGGSP